MKASEEPAFFLLLIQGLFGVENRPENPCEKSKSGSWGSAKFSGRAKP
jgi:hypothetical protein